jgi:hypothetical protein
VTAAGAACAGTSPSSPRTVLRRSLQEAVDTTTPGGKLVFHVVADLAEFERDLIRERTAAGLAAARLTSSLGAQLPVRRGASSRTPVPALVTTKETRPTSDLPLRVGPAAADIGGCPVPYRRSLTRAGTAGCQDGVVAAR